MKQFYFFLLLAFLSLNINSQIINFPDANFKAALVSNPAINTNGDGEITQTEAFLYIGDIDVSGLNINSLSGIEHFTSISGLFCQNNNIGSINIPNSTFLTTLNCQNNNLFGVTLASSLEILICNDNTINQLDLSNYPNLSYLQCQNNNINSLSIANNPNLTLLNCSNNSLYLLNAKNGANNTLATMSAINNLLLSCIQVDDEPNATAGNGVYASWQKDGFSSYSENCVPCNVTIPDTNFKNALLADISINQNDDGEIQCVEAEAVTGTINVNNLGITDLTGIEAFINITDLRCADNLLTSLSISSNNELTNLNCRNNQLISLATSSNPSLSMLNMNDNNITVFNASANDNLTAVLCSGNQLSALNLKNGANNILTTVEADNNPLLACIQVDNETAANSGSNVYGSWVVDNQITYSEDCSSCVVAIPDTNLKNALLSDSTINTNSDSEIQCTEAAAFNGFINVSLLSISDLTGIEAFFNITNLNCSGNNLTSLDLPLNSLETLTANNNNLTSLNVDSCPNLESINVNNNNLPNLDLSNNVQLDNVQCEFNDLINLNLKNGNNNALVGVQIHNNPTLQCIQVDNEVDANANNGVYSLWVKDTSATYSEDCSTLSIETFREDAFSLYPNPVVNILFVFGQVDANYSIININGQQLKEGYLVYGENAIDISPLKSGLYFIKVVTDEGLLIKKILKR